MKNIIFDGVGYAARLKMQIRSRAEAIAWERGRKLKLVSILNPDFRSARVYSGIKKRQSDELGVEFERVEVLGYRFRQIHKQATTDVEKLIARLNKDAEVDGIMIQMPLGSGEDQMLCELIDPNKDVDGLGKKSKYVAATVRAVMGILDEAQSDEVAEVQRRILVVGNKGVVGSRLQKELGCEGMDKDDFDAGLLMLADVVIACTGQAGLITGEMVKEGVIAIDVGWPKGDLEFASVMPKSSFITPVPGGVGPVTVMKLFENLVDSVDK